MELKEIFELLNSLRRCSTNEITEGLAAIACIDLEETIEAWGGEWKDVDESTKALITDVATILGFGITETDILHQSYYRWAN